MVEVWASPRHARRVLAHKSQTKTSYCPSSTGLALTFLMTCLPACRSDREPPSEETRTSQQEGKNHSPARATIQHVPVGTFNAGSWPGESGRNPSVEAATTKVKLGPFRIDVYPYPGDPKKAPLLGTSVSEATALCASKQGRLCTELEWERACRGPDSALYPTGTEPCSDHLGSNCLSGFDVAKMGSLPEWTASTFGNASNLKGQAVVRGAPAGLPDTERRCARRNGPQKKEVDQVGFRCCYGAPNAARMKEPLLGPAYKKQEITPQELSTLLAADPKTASLAKKLRLFKPEAARTVLARGPGETMGFHLTTQALEWQPARGSRFLVVAGRSGKETSFVVAFFLSEAKKTLAGSIIMKGERGPIALAYAESIRPRLHFSSCWGCPGETGKVLFREPEELVFLQP